MRLENCSAYENKHTGAASVAKLKKKKWYWELNEY